MNFFKRAIRSVTRQKSKSLILFAVICLLGNILAGSVIIQQATQNVEKTTKEQMGALATVDIDWNDPKTQKEMEQSNGALNNPLSVKLIEKIGASPYVKNYDYSESSGFDSQQLKSFDPSGAKKNKTEEKADDKTGTYNAMDTYIPIRGVQDPKIMDISLGKIKLADGAVFSEADVKKGTLVVLVSKEFASKNGLHVGDEMTIDQSLMTPGNIDEKDKASTKASFDTKVKVVGTYQVLEAVQKKSGKSKKSDNDSVVHAAAIGGDGDQDMLDFATYNTIYMPNKAVHTINQGYMKYMMEKSPELFTGMSEKDLKNATESRYTPIYQLKSIDNLDKFKSDTKPLLPKPYAIMASTDEFNKIAGQFNKLSKIAKAVIIAAISLSIILILLVILLFMRDRKRELGIYLSLGDKKSTIILQIMVEVLTVASVALIISLVSGKFLGEFASEAFLSSNNSQETANVMMGGTTMYSSALFGSGSAMNAKTVAENYAVTFTPFYIVTYLLSGLGTVMISVLLSTLYIFKLKPKKILLG